MNEARLTDAELAEISRDVGRFASDPDDAEREHEAARHLPRLFAEVRRLREVEKRMRQYDEGTYRPPTQE